MKQQKKYMMNILSTSFENIKQSKSFYQIFKSLERGLKKYEIDFYIIGAIAKDIWLEGIYNKKTGRVTRDIDLGVLVKNKEKFDLLKQYLINKENFRDSKDNPFVLISNNNYQIDIIPFGEIEKEKLKLLKGTTFSSLNSEGLHDIYKSGVPEVRIGKTNRYKVCPLPGLVILKLISWNDRPELRIEDLQDVSIIITHYFEINDERIFNNHNELFEDGKGLNDIGARVLGRDMAKILIDNPGLNKKIKKILSKNTENQKSPLGKTMVKYIDINLTEAIQNIKEIIRGLND